MRRRDPDDSAVPPERAIASGGKERSSTEPGTKRISSHPPPSSALNFAVPSSVSAGARSSSSRLPPLVTSEVLLPPEQDGTGHDPFAEFEDDDTDDEALPKESTRIEAGSPSLEQVAVREIPDSSRPELVVVSGPRRGRRFPLRPGDNVVGRATDCDVIIADNAVSRRHCVLRVERGAVRIRDLGSGNGSMLRGAQVTEALLQWGDAFSIGKTELVLQMMSESVQVDGDLVGSDELQAHDFEAELADVETVRPGVAARNSIDVPRLPLPTARNAPPTVPIRTQRGDDDVAGPSASLSPASLALIALVALLSGVAGTLLTLVVTGRGGSGNVAAPAAATDAYLDGMEHLSRGDLDGAERAFTEVLRIEPTHDKAPAQLARVLTYRGHERAVENARLALREGDADKAVSLLVGVPNDSPFASAAQVVTLAARAETFRRIEQSVNDALGEGRVEDAAAQVATLRALGAPEARVEDVQRSVSEAESDLASAAAGKGRRQVTASRPAGGFSFARGEVLKRYRAGQFDAASSTAAQFAQTLPPEARDEFLGLSRRIGRFASLMTLMKSNPSATVEKGTAALQLDREISGGHYGKSLVRSIVAEQLKRASSAFSNRVYDKACVAVRAAMLVAPDHAEARRLATRCDAEAGRLAEQARSLETERGAEAKRLYRQIMVMTAPGSAAYRAAYSRLNFLARPQSDTPQP